MSSFYRPLIFLFAAIISHSALHAQASSPADGAFFSFVETAHDFGKVPTDTAMEYRFEFVNSGNKMLVITDISLSCPCFTADWSHGPVMPGKKGWVSVHYPTGDHTGPFDKILWIISNAVNKSYDPGRFELRIKGEVEKAVTIAPKASLKHAAALQPKHSGAGRTKSSAKMRRR